MAAATTNDRTAGRYGVFWATTLLLCLALFSVGGAMGSVLGSSTNVQVSTNPGSVDIVEGVVTPRTAPAS
ncbi:hypothetical protein GCM10025865_16740 [Paraoerskovia sediminicola]|uniref:Uncharacterized protein n=1 Tax=Paraoerskovia sediminicola TaxID=1138587 RepID=A0ABM8G2M0_9CELL|nr:hypothetical protein [Paraoerskovia sediminicola]BDZ42375.1 hypothetical protein GCM10025865_16740 [Paraoerskovia sediminicola]